MSRTKGLFRVEFKDLGQFVVLDPYIPRRASVSEDVTIPRIPVCAEVGECLRAITTLHLKDRGWVYRARMKPRPQIDYDSPMKLVPDWEDTNEVWITEAVGFERVGEIEIASGILREPEIEWRWLPRGHWKNA